VAKSQVIIDFVTEVYNIYHILNVKADFNLILSYARNFFPHVFKKHFQHI